ncbi:hypothetical protein WSM22_42730 [Cytophagales bacterium WSM2-2]|nr:hypothetical protein WSM22_42730 [Cytophagales bacterium WSM2-2]
MTTNDETGNAKTVATFEVLTGNCAKLGTAYDPKKNSLKLTTLNALLVLAYAVLQKVKDGLTVFQMATNIRMVTFGDVRKLATKVINALEATDAPKQTIKNARSSYYKIQGRRVNPVEEPVAVEGQPAPEPAKTRSVSQQSYDNLVEHFAQLVTTVAAEPSYDPNEAELKVPYLKGIVLNMRNKNTDVINASLELRSVRVERDKLLYAKEIGLVPIALSVKKYINSVFGPTSIQYKDVKGLRFWTRRIS